MRLSTRNQLSCTVVDVTVGAVMATVKVKLDGGEQVVTVAEMLAGGVTTSDGKPNWAIRMGDPIPGVDACGVGSLSEEALHAPIGRRCA